MTNIYMTINIIPINSLYFASKKGNNLFIDIVHNNFIYLSRYPILKHNRNEIYRLLNSPNFRGFLVKKDNKIIGYLLGEINRLTDGRTIFFISYLYISQYFRNRGLASKLIDLIIDISRKQKLDAIVLISDTENKKVYDFYLKRGFMPDLILRRYHRYEVISLPIKF